MDPSILLLLAINFIVVLFTISWFPMPAVSRPHDNFTDLESLLAFKAGVADPHGILTTNWSTDAPFCSWIGIFCGHSGQRVVALELANISLQGTISPNLGNLSFLSHLNLRYNNLTGHVPESISRLPRLTNFYLDYNYLSGPIPSSIFNMSSLIAISLTANIFSGSLPSNHDYFRLPRLTVISLSKNNLSGNIPSHLSRCSTLHTVSLSYNQFSGNIPPELGNLTGLNLLYLGENQLTGTIPASIGNVTKLGELDLEFNGVQGPIPEELGNLADLYYLNLGSNSLTGSIPMSLSNASNLQFLALSTNNLTGTIPITLGQTWSQLNILALDVNQLTGELDFIASLSNCRNLEYLVMGYNNLQGVLPDSVGNLSTKLGYFEIHNNHIEGEIPIGFSNLSGLLELDLQTNELTGAVPSELSRLKKLGSMNIGLNRISGPIPFEFGLMTNLAMLQLSGNTISGPIPYSLGNISGLQILFLAANRLSSNIPVSLWNLNGLIKLDLSQNSLDGQLPQQIRNLKSLTVLELGANQLSGSMPSALGELQMIQYLDLSNNSFHGQIPLSVKGLISIVYLNLSYNFLTGAIPKSLANLTDLATLDLSFNELEGQIPEGRVFSNHSISSLEGNMALCGAVQLGFPLCTSSVVGSNSKSKSQILKYILPSIAVVLLCCLGIGLVTFVRLRNTKLVLPSEDTLNNFRAITYFELVRATDNFSDANLLGRGSSSSVFKASLNDGSIFAVKVLNLEDEAASQSFDVESFALSKVRHRNLVKIISTCSSMDFKALILQFISNGSLEVWLHSENIYLNLLQRIDIMVDVSLAFEYLHHHHREIILHRDLKPSNVLLDENMVAHVSDFGISKILSGGESKSILSASAPGTFGYMAPEYGSTGKISRKGDVYSFGILLLETFTRKKPSDAMFHGEFSLRQWINNAYPSAVFEIVDPDLLREDSTTRQPDPALLHQCLPSLIELGLICSSDSEKERILMKDVVPILLKIKKEYISKVAVVAEDVEGNG